MNETGATYPAVYGRMEWDAPSPTITTQCFGYGNGRFGHPEQNRAISLREAAMLQGFPREYSFVSEATQFTFAKLGRLHQSRLEKRLVKHLWNTLANTALCFLFEGSSNRSLFKTIRLGKLFNPRVQIADQHLNFNIIAPLT